jgi:hypothetical protein
MRCFIGRSNRSIFLSCRAGGRALSDGPQRSGQAGRTMAWPASTAASTIFASDAGISPRGSAGSGGSCSSRSTSSTRNSRDLRATVTCDSAQFVRSCDTGERTRGEVSPDATRHLVQAYLYRRFASIAKPISLRSPVAHAQVASIRAPLPPPRCASLLPSAMRRHVGGWSRGAWYRDYSHLSKRRSPKSISLLGHSPL